MNLFKKPTPKQKRAKTLKIKKSDKLREQKQARKLTRLEAIRKNQEVKAQIEKAKAEKVIYRTERLRQLPIVGKRLYGSTAKKATPRKRRRTKILGRGSGWGL